MGGNASKPNDWTNKPYPAIFIYWLPFDRLVRSASATGVTRSNLFLQHSKGLTPSFSGAEKKGAQRLAGLIKLINGNLLGKRMLSLWNGGNKRWRCSIELNPPSKQSPVPDDPQWSPDHSNRSIGSDSEGALLLIVLPMDHYIDLRNKKQSLFLSHVWCTAEGRGEATQKTTLPKRVNLTSIEIEPVLHGTEWMDHFCYEGSCQREGS